MTFPSAAAFTTLVFSAFISIPGCVTHSFNVSEYTNLSFAYSLNVSPSTGLIKIGSSTFSSLTSFFSSSILVSVVVVVSSVLFVFVLLETVLFAIVFSFFVVFAVFVFDTLLFVLFTLFCSFNDFSDSVTFFPS